MNLQKLIYNDKLIAEAYSKPQLPFDATPTLVDDVTKQLKALLIWTTETAIQCKLRSRNGHPVNWVRHDDKPPYLYKWKFSDDYPEDNFSMTQSEMVKDQKLECIKAIRTGALQIQRVDRMFGTHKCKEGLKNDGSSIWVTPMKDKGKDLDVDIAYSRLKQDLEVSLHQTLDKFSEIQSEKSDLNDQVESLCTQRSKLRLEKADLQQKLDSLQKENGELQAQNEELKICLGTRRENGSGDREYEQKIAELREIIDRQKQDILEGAQEQIKLHKRINDLMQGHSRETHYSDVTQKPPNQGNPPRPRYWTPAPTMSAFDPVGDLVKLYPDIYVGTKLRDLKLISNRWKDLPHNVLGPDMLPWDHDLGEVGFSYLEKLSNVMTPSAAKECLEKARERNGGLSSSSGTVIIAHDILHVLNSMKLVENVLGITEQEEPQCKAARTSLEEKPAIHATPTGRNKPSWESLTPSRESNQDLKRKRSPSSSSASHRDAPPRKTWQP